MYISYSYLTRYYRSTTGQTSANWLFNTIKTIGDANPAIVVTQFSHTASGFNQASVIARIPGTSAATSKHFYIYIYLGVNGTNFLTVRTQLCWAPISIALVQQQLVGLLVLMITALGR